MGLYDRDYMRDAPTGKNDEPPGLDRMISRRRRLIMIGVVVTLAAMLAIVLSH